MNGGDDGTRTRGLCHDRSVEIKMYRWCSFEILYQRELVILLQQMRPSNRICRQHVRTGLLRALQSADRALIAQNRSIQSARVQAALKTAGRENPNRCAITRQPTELLGRKLELSRLNQAGWKARKHPATAKYFFLTFPFIELSARGALLRFVCPQLLAGQHRHLGSHQGRLPERGLDAQYSEARGSQAQADQSQRQHAGGSRGCRGCKVRNGYVEAQPQTAMKKGWRRLPAFFVLGAALHLAHRESIVSFRES